MAQNQCEYSEEAKAWAALFALGSLCGEEKVQFEQHLQQGCPVCGAEMRSLNGVVRDLALSAPHAMPPSRVRERLLESLVGSKPKVGISPGVLVQEPGLLISRSSDMS